MTAAPSSPLLELRGISKRFGAVQALTDVRFEVRAGEVVALVGDNGAGKSTLIKIVSGIFPPDSGTIIFEGREVTLQGPADAVALGISTVYQDLALADNLDVVANLFLGREVGSVGGAFGTLDEISMEKRAIAAIAALSGGQRQAVAAARSVLWENKVVLLDEPTAALGVGQTNEVLELVRRLRDDGRGVVLISHNLEDVFAVADRITVLRLGRYVGTYDAKTVTREQLVSYMTGAMPGTAEVPLPASAAQAT